MSMNSRFANSARTVSAALLVAVFGMVSHAVVLNTESSLAPKMRDFRDRQSYVDAFAEAGMKYLNEQERANAKRRIGGIDALKRDFQRMAGKKWDEYAKSHAPSRTAVSSARSAVTFNPRLDGMFGVALGKPIDVSTLTRPIGALDPNRWSFAPKKQFRKYETYYVDVTPVTHIVCRVVAAGQKLVDADHPMTAYAATIKEEYGYVKQALEQKFGKAETVGAGACCAYEIPFFDKNGVKIERKIEVSANGTQIVARDFAAEALMEREIKLEKQKQQKKDAVKQEDLDAL